MKRWPFALAFGLMGATGLFLSSRTGAEPTLIRKPLAELSLSLGGWAGRDLAMDDRVLAVLKLTDHLMRQYAPPESGRAELGVFEGRLRQAAAPVGIYVGYYGSQRTGATYHSPKNCLPGGGWQLESAATWTGVVPGAPEAAVNRVVAAKGLERQLILYWYQDRGRVVASEYAAKGYLIWDAMTRNRTDGSMVRISTRVVSSEEDAARHALAFLQVSWEPLAQHLPE